MPPLQIRVTTQIFDEGTGGVRYANSAEIYVGITGTGYMMTEYPRRTINASWDGNGSVLFRSLMSFWTNDKEIVPGDYEIKATLARDTRIWQRVFINLGADGAVVITRTEGP